MSLKLDGYFTEGIAEKKSEFVHSIFIYYGQLLIDKAYDNLRSEEDALLVVRKVWDKFMMDRFQGIELGDSVEKILLNILEDALSKTYIVDTDI